jgi:hypothetical protein
VALAVGGALVWQKASREKAALPSVHQAGPSGIPGVNSPDVAKAVQAPPSPAARSLQSADPGLSASLSGRPHPVRRIRIETEPAGASVSLENGPELGTTPLQADASTLDGRRLHFFLEGYERKVVPGSALGQRDTFRVELEPVLGMLEAIQAIPWAKVYLGDRYLGETPLTAVRLPLGRNRLRFVNEPLGVERFEVVTVRPGGNPKLIVPMAGTGR